MARAGACVALACAVTAAAPPAPIPSEGSSAPRSHIQPAGDVSVSREPARALGLELSRASAVLRRQLALKRGAGLVVDDVGSGSPAASAGFTQHDVLVKLDDQLLVLPEQFDALLESAEPGQPLACTVLRGGREVVIPLAGAAPAGRAAAPLRPAASALALVQPAATVGPVSAGSLRRLSRETLLRHDADFQIRLTCGPETRLVVADPQGRVVFNDAIDTPERRGRMPAAVRTRVAEMERMLEQPDDGDPPSTAAPRGGTAVIGRLDVEPIEIR